MEKSSHWTPLAAKCRAVALFSFFNFDTDKSSQARIDMISYSIQEIFTNFKTFFIGNGVGSFGVDFLGKEVLEYPHIIFLEVWYELGILGFILIVTFLIAPLLFKRNIIYISFLLLILFDSIKSLNLLNMWITVIIYSIIILAPCIPFCNNKE